jgi:hypothetical protein
MFTGRFSAQLRLRYSASANPTSSVVAICRTSSQFIASYRISRAISGTHTSTCPDRLQPFPITFKLRVSLHLFNFMALVQSHKFQPATSTRKFSLVKCERCRLDKQKCLPTKREWPNRCNRCAEKDFTCSPGRRIQRKSKHTAVS